MKHNQQKIRSLLEKGKRLTVVSALRLANTVELRVYISKLRKEGLNIADEWTERNGKRFKTYFIAK